MPIEVKYEPFKELVIKDHTYEPNAEKLASLVAPAIAVGAQAYLQWADGVVYVPSTAPPDVQYDELLEGKVIWLGVTFAPMPKFASLIKVGGIEVPVIDVSKSELSVAAAKWLKNQMLQAH
ncbi:MAG: hypothetical protein JRN21_00035 [Nitrososphaerota archaeon]|nr:hypothetical protein [Nitrososphaerota archaeon]